jgi:hypothetical protein
VTVRGVAAFTAVELVGGTVFRFFAVADEASGVVLSAAIFLFFDAAAEVDADVEGAELGTEVEEEETGAVES